MNDLEAIQARHSVRAYTTQPIEDEKLQRLEDVIARCNAEGDLNIQLCSNNPDAFGDFSPYGTFKNVANHVALIGERSSDLHERCGYFGERIVLEAQKLGLSTCWVALSYKKKESPSQVLEGQSRPCVIAVGYGADQGRKHKVKPIEKLCRVQGEMPAWFRAGMEAAQLAPTAINQQKFLIELVDRGEDDAAEGACTDGGLPKVSAKALAGPYSKVDLGIVKLHFEVGADSVTDRWEWTPDSRIARAS